MTGVERLLTIPCLCHSEAMGFENAACDLAHHAAVIDDEACPIHTLCLRRVRRVPAAWRYRAPQQTPIEAIDAAAELRPGRRQRRRIVRSTRCLEAQDLGHLIHQQRVSHHPDGDHRHCRRPGRSSSSGIYRLDGRLLVVLDIARLLALGETS